MSGDKEKRRAIKDDMKAEGLFYEGPNPELQQKEVEFGDKNHRRKPIEATTHQAENPMDQIQVGTDGEGKPVFAKISPEQMAHAVRSVEFMNAKLRELGSWKQTAIDAGVTAGFVLTGLGIVWGVNKLFFSATPKALTPMVK